MTGPSVFAGRAAPLVLGALLALLVLPPTTSSAGAEDTADSIRARIRAEEAEVGRRQSEIAEARREIALMQEDAKRASAPCKAWQAHLAELETNRESIEEKTREKKEVERLRGWEDPDWWGIAAWADKHLTPSGYGPHGERYQKVLAQIEALKAARAALRDTFAGRLARGEIAGVTARDVRSLRGDVARSEMELREIRADILVEEVRIADRERRVAEAAERIRQLRSDLRALASAPGAEPGPGPGPVQPPDPVPDPPRVEPTQRPSPGSARLALAEPPLDRLAKDTCLHDRSHAIRVRFVVEGLAPGAVAPGVYYAEVLDAAGRKTYLFGALEPGSADLRFAGHLPIPFGPVRLTVSIPALPAVSAVTIDGVRSPRSTGDLATAQRILASLPEDERRLGTIRDPEQRRGRHRAIATGLIDAGRMLLAMGELDAAARACDAAGRHLADGANDATWEAAARLAEVLGRIAFWRGDAASLERHQRAAAAAHLEGARWMEARSRSPRLERSAACDALRDLAEQLLVLGGPPERSLEIYREAQAVLAFSPGSLSGKQDGLWALLRASR